MISGVSQYIRPPKKYVLQIILIIGLVCLISINSLSQENLSPRINLDFKFLNSNEGLSHNNVYTLFEDSEGFIWIGTENGLNLYNGHTFKYFQKEGKSDNEINGNEISVIVEDKYGRIWIGTFNDGLCWYDKVKGKFHRVKLENDFNRVTSSIQSLHIDGDFIWIGFETGYISKLNINNFQYKNFIPTFDLGRTIVYNDAIKFITSDKENVWASTSSGYLHKIDKKTESFDILNISKQAGVVLQITQIQDWVNDEYLLTTSNGFYTFEKNSYKANPINIYGDSFKYKMNDLFIDHSNNIWVCTEGNGIILFTPDSTRLVFDKQRFKYQWIPELDIRKIIQTKDDLIWIATYGGGVIQFNPGKLIFNHYMYDPADVQGLRDDGINAFCESGDGQVWIGTDASGLHKFDPATGSFKNYYNYAPLKYFEKSSILVIHPAETKDHLWVGTYKKGLVYFDTKNGTGHDYQYVKQKSIHPSHAIYSFLKIDDETIWLGTNGYGILEFNTRTRTYTDRFYLTSNDSSLSNDYIRNIFKDSNGDIWVGSFGGLCKYLGNGKFKRYAFLDHESNFSLGLVSEIYEDKKGRFWLGNSVYGLILMDRENEDFYHYTADDGFHSDHVYGVEEDENGTLWLITDKGLIAAQVDSSIDGKPSISFRYFYKEDGLQDDAFISGSIYRDSDSTIYAGGQNGFNFFQPRHALNLQPSEVGIHLEDLSLNGKRILPSDSIGVSKTIDYLDTLKLWHDESDFSLNIIALNYKDVNRLHYSYKLEGYESNWNSLTDSRRINYTNLPLGNYVLKFRASVDGQNWIEREKDLRIIVEGPWYKYWYGRALIILALLLLFLGIYLNRLNNIRKQKYKLQKLVEEQSAEIRKQNMELILRNEQLNDQYEEIVKSREELRVKKENLEEMQERLKDVNNLLEGKVLKRTEQLNSTIDQLNETINKLDSFLFNTSEQIDQPIQAISGFLEVLRMEEQSTKNHTYLEHIQSNIRKLELIKQQLQNFSSNSRSNLSFEKVELRKLLQEVKNDVSVRHDLNGLNIINKIDEKAIIFSDKQRLRIAFSNILSNAINYTDKSKSDQRIEMSSFENLANWEISIRDNGMGIAQKELPKIFQMFYKSNGSSHGTGLGLFISKEILDNLKANISVESEQNVGTTINVSFPKVKG